MSTYRHILDEDTTNNTDVSDGWSAVVDADDHVVALTETQGLAHLLLAGLAGKPVYALIKMFSGIEPQLYGPYPTERERTEALEKFCADDEEDDLWVSLDVVPNPHVEPAYNMEAGSFSGAYMEWLRKDVPEGFVRCTIGKASLFSPWLVAFLHGETFEINTEAEASQFVLDSGGFDRLPSETDIPAHECAGWERVRNCWGLGVVSSCPASYHPDNRPDEEPDDGQLS